MFNYRIRRLKEQPFIFNSKFELNNNNNKIIVVNTTFWTEFIINIH